MMTDRALLQQALDALEDCLDDNFGWYDGALDLQRALRARLAQPEERSADIKQDALTGKPELRGGGYSKVQLEQLINGRLNVMRPVPLTDAQIEEVRQRIFSTGNPYCPVDNQAMRKVARAIEAAHNIKELTMNNDSNLPAFPVEDQPDWVRNALPPTEKFDMFLPEDQPDWIRNALPPEETK